MYPYMWSQRRMVNVGSVGCAQVTRMLGPRPGALRLDLAIVSRHAVFTCQRERDNTRHPMDKPQHQHKT
jgi:hypothetical protein